MEEEWKVNPNYPHLEISNLGVVRNRYPNRPIANLYKQIRDDGTIVITSDGRADRVYRIPLARIVAATFILTTPTDLLSHEIVYLDGDKANCRADNLAWDREEE